MATSHKITINGKTIYGRSGELLLDAALKGGVEMPYDCRAGHCGTCCVKLTGGQVKGGESTQPGMIHACQSRIISDIAVETSETPSVKSVRGYVKSLRNLSPEVLEVEIRTDQALPYLPGQYAQLRFKGYPSRPYSLTHPLRGRHDGQSLWFHIRRVKDGWISRALGHEIPIGHRLTVTGPYGSAYFRPNLENRMILISTATGFAPIWSILATALHENPNRMIMLIVGGSTLDSLYMGPALGRLKRFPNVRIMPCCSGPQTHYKAIRKGRPTDYMPRLYASDVVYACGMPAMVDNVRSIAARAGAACYADPFVQATQDKDQSTIKRAFSWLPLSNSSTARRKLARIASQRKQLSLQDRRSPSFAAG